MNEFNFVRYIYILAVDEKKENKLNGLFSFIHSFFVYMLVVVDEKKENKPNG